MLRGSTQHFRLPRRDGRPNGGSHVLDPEIKPTDEQTQAADDLIHALRSNQG
jgi:hypothetical protein